MAFELLILGISLFYKIVIGARHFMEGVDSEMLISRMTLPVGFE
jgi:hypothetical protein